MYLVPLAPPLAALVPVEYLPCSELTARLAWDITSSPRIEPASAAIPLLSLAPTSKPSATSLAAFLAFFEGLFESVPLFDFKPATVAAPKVSPDCLASPPILSFLIFPESSDSLAITVPAPTYPDATAYLFSFPVTLAETMPRLIRSSSFSLLSETET